MYVETYQRRWKDIRNDVNDHSYTDSGFCPYTMWLEENISQQSTEGDAD